MTFLSQNTVCMEFVVAIVTISFVTLVIGFFSNNMGGKNKVTTIAILLLLFVTLVDLGALMELLRLSQKRFDIKLFAISKFVDGLPYVLHIALAALSIGYAIYICHREYTAIRNSITGFSIKEALEKLPSGIAFTSENSKLCLSNNIMHELCKELTGKNLINGAEFWGKILDMRMGDHCIIEGDAPAFILSDGSVWQFTRRSFQRVDGKYFELKATDITSLQNIRKSTQQANAVLSGQQQRLESLTDIIEKNAREQVAVDMRVRFHDDFGNLLAMTKKTLKASPSLEDTKAIALHFGKLTDIIERLASSEGHNLSIEQILLFSEKLGCKVKIEGEIPQDDEVGQIILLSINEALKNAYRHANAEELTVKITQTGQMVTAVMHNTLNFPIDKITEGGGLKGLRQRVEKSGGKFSLSTEDGVAIVIQLVISDC